MQKIADRACDSDKGKILFVSNELAYTGAPTSLLRMCKVAKKLGYYPVVWSMKDGGLVNEFERIGINVCILGTNPQNANIMIDDLKMFSFAICNTVVTDKFVKYISEFIPVIWFIREGYNTITYCKKDDERFNTLKSFPNVYCVSEYARKPIIEIAKHDVKIIHNCVEDISELATSYLSGTGSKIKFVQFGTIMERKGYDVFFEAFLKMPIEYLNKAELYFAGGIPGGRKNAYVQKILEIADNTENIHYLGVVQGDKNKAEVLSKMDVVVVASRDESCSLVALEGCMFSKPIIVTENVGAKYMVSGGNGRIVKTADAESLREAMMYMIDNKEHLAEMGKKSRENYESKASMENHVKELGDLFQQFNQKGKIKPKDNRYVFPFHLFKCGDKIVIYGDASLANEFKIQASETDYVKIMGVVDALKIEQDGILSLEYDAILIAVTEQACAIDLKNKLISYGIQPERIKWDGDSYSWLGFLRSIYFNILEVCNTIEPVERRDYLYVGRGQEIRCDNFADYASLDALNYDCSEKEIDVILPIYNAYEYTKICIESILRNTTTPYNLYLVNDCSTDKRIHSFLMNIKRLKKPKELRNLFIIEHKKNMGFQQSINEAICDSTNHIVIINSDTEVPRGWLKRLVYPMIHSEKVASVTPTTNASSMCSFPAYGEDNELINNSSLEVVDDVFSCFSSNMNIEIPVGTGFCMALNRKALENFGVFDSAFEKGYGEETDWCLRVRKNGWKNIWALNLFVYHKHGVSFNSKTSVVRDTLIRKSNELIDKRYPDFKECMRIYRTRMAWGRAYEWAECLLCIKQLNTARKTLYFEPMKDIPASDGSVIMRRIPEDRFLLKIFRTNRWHDFCFFTNGLKVKDIERFLVVTGINKVVLNAKVVDCEAGLKEIYSLIMCDF